MATMRQVDTRIWKDSWFRKLNALDRYAFIYLLTNENCSWCGVYELPLSVFAFESGIDERDLENSILPKLEPKVFYVDGWIYIKSFIKYHDTGSPNSKKGIENALNLVPSYILAQIKEKNNGLELFETVGNCRHTSSSSSSSSFTSKEDFSDEKSSLKKTQVEHKTLKDFRNERRAEAGKGKWTPRRTDKQKETADALSWLEDFKKKGYEQHGMMFLEVHDESRNKAIRKLVIRAYNEIGPLGELHDWWFSGAGEWAGYEPENCYSSKMLERFKNRKNNKQKLTYYND